jgi:hypothetical protein
MDYDLKGFNKTKKGGCSYTIASRFKQSSFIKEEKGLMYFLSLEITPGPNEYNPKLFTTEKAASLKGQHKEFTRIIKYF